LIVREARLRVAGRPYDLTFHFSAIEPAAATEAPLHPGLMDDIREGRVQGVLTVGLPVRAVQWVSEQGVAVVAFAGEGPASVNLDSVDVVELGIKALVERGCRRLALWGEMGSDTTAESRAEPVAFRRILAERDLAFHSHWLRPQAGETIGRSNFELARDWAKEVFGGSRDEWPDGLLITNDILTRDVIPALQKLDIRPNRDVVIASHANTDSPVLHAYESDLMLLEYNSGEIVQAMFDQLETLLRGEIVPDRHIIIRPEATVRAVGIAGFPPEP
jgi:DNA-binding LacI/PurR family transcriptional regulator